MSKGTKRSEARKPVLIRRSHPVRDNIEGILGALLLALIVRHFVFEMFVIPTPLEIEQLEQLLLDFGVLEGAAA